MFFLWHTSRHQPIAVIGGRCRSRADNLQPGTVEAGRVQPCTLEQLAWSQCAVELVTSAAPWELAWYAPVFQFSWSVGQQHSSPTGVSAVGYRQFHTAGCCSNLVYYLWYPVINSCCMCDVFRLQTTSNDVESGAQGHQVISEQRLSSHVGWFTAPPSSLQTCRLFDGSRSCALRLQLLLVLETAAWCSKSRLLVSASQRKVPRDCVMTLCKISWNL